MKKLGTYIQLISDVTPDNITKRLQSTDDDQL